MDTFDLKQEQRRLARKLRFESIEGITSVAGVFCAQKENKLQCAVVRLSYPSLELLEEQTYLLDNPLPKKEGFRAYNELPAITECINQLDQDPSILLVDGPGVVHPQGCGIASHVGIMLNIPTISVTEKLKNIEIKEENEVWYNNKLCGHTFITKKHAKPLLATQGYNTCVADINKLFPSFIKEPHKLPEPLHLARKLAKKALRKAL